LNRVELFVCTLMASIAMSCPVIAAPLESYGRLPQYENVALSPDGEKAAFVTTVGEQREIIVQSLASKDGVIRLRAGAQKIRDINWVGTEQLLITVSQSPGYFGSEQDENFTVQNFDLRRKQAFGPMEWLVDTLDLMSYSPMHRVVDGKPVVYLHGFTKPPISYTAGPNYFTQALFRSDLKDQTTRLIDAAPENNPRQHYRWAIDMHGDPAVQSVYDEGKKSWVLSTKRNGQWQKAYSESTLIDTPGLIGFYRDNIHFLIKKLENGKWVLRDFSLADGAWSEPLPDRCCGEHYISDPKTNLIVGSSWQDARRHYLFYDKTLQQRWDQVVQSFPGEEVTLESYSNGLNKMVVKVFGKTSGAAYFLVDMDAKQTSRLGDVYAGIATNDIKTVKPIVYNAADGLQIPGYLTLPSGKAIKNLPLIVMPHGGPAARDELRFEWFAQALASRGYLVLQPNFRGSWGIDWSLEQAGYGEYGRKMQTDVSDGVRALVKLGIVDPKRVCIVGASYGGYVALMGATRETDIYRCAVSIAGVSDLRANFDKHLDPAVSPDSGALRYMLRYTGATTLNDAVLVERSPAMHAETVSGPVLLIHGDNDAVVSIEQSEIMASALKKAGKPYEFVKLKSEDHWLSKADTRLQMLQAVVKFLETNNPP